eukprot:1066292-Amphidinium_carterae.1
MSASCNCSENVALLLELHWRASLLEAYGVGVPSAHGCGTHVAMRHQRIPQLVTLFVVST